jgi:predicted SAM-dependent methyltransferase
MLTRELFYSSQNKLKFDLITMFQVAEHLSVQELLEEDVFARIYNALEPGGQLVIETPTHDCNYARKFRSDWRALEMPRHLVIFSPKSLSKMLTAKGFSVKVFTRVSPIDVKESFLLRYPGKGIKTLFRKGSHLLRIMFFQKRNSSLLTVVAQKGF